MSKFLIPTVVLTGLLVGAAQARSFSGSDKVSANCTQASKHFATDRLSAVGSAVPIAKA